MSVIRFLGNDKLILSPFTVALNTCMPFFFNRSVGHEKKYGKKLSDKKNQLLLLLLLTVIQCKQ
jgi:hypothetical protein